MTRVARAMTAELDALFALEQRASVRPWQRQVFVEELGREFSYVMGMWDEETLVAFIVYWIVRDELHVLNVVTDPDRRRKGYAARLVEHAVAAAKRAGCVSLLLEVRRSNTAATRLYKKYGFRPIGVRASYYAEEHEDAIVMKLALRPS